MKNIFTHKKTTSDVVSYAYMQVPNRTLLIFGGILGILVVDPLTGSMWTFYEKDYNVKLYPDTPDGQAARKADEMARAAEAKAKEDEQREKQAFPQ